MSAVQLRHLCRCVVEPSNESLPVVQLEHIEGSTARIIGPLRVAHQHGLIRFQAGDVLFSKLRPYLAKSLLVEEAMHGTGELLCLRPHPSLDSRYLKYLTLSRFWLDHAVLTSYGTKMPRTSWEHMAAVRVPDIDLEKQRRIADFLDDRVARIDKIIAARRAQIDASKALEQSRLEASLVHTSDTMIPLRRFGITVTTGPFGTVFAATDYVRDGVPMVNPTHIKDGVVLPDVDHSVSEETAERLTRHRLREHDLVVSRKGDIGRTAMIGPHQDGWICGSDSIALHANDTKMLPEMLDLLLKLDSVRDQLLAQSNAATMPSLNEGNLLSLMVPAISIDEQMPRVEAARVARQWSRAFGTQINASIDLLSEYKRSLITAAVSGELDVSTAASGIPG